MMAHFIVRRLMVMVFIVFLLSLTVFYLLRVMPGDPTGCPPFSPPECREAREAELGLNRPYFPVSVDTSSDQDWWILAVPVAGVAGILLLRRRLRAAPH
jgi:hypothetical protein